MKFTNFRKVSPKETQEKQVLFFSVGWFVTSQNVETTARASVSLTHWCVRVEEELCLAHMSYLKLLLTILRHFFVDENFRVE